jgi:hypothetical protein
VHLAGRQAHQVLVEGVVRGRHLRRHDGRVPLHRRAHPCPPWQHAGWTGTSRATYAAALDAVLRRDHLMAPDALDELTVVGARRLGARTAVLWLVDYDQVSLGGSAARPAPW